MQIVYFNKIVNIIHMTSEIVQRQPHWNDTFRNKVSLLFTIITETCLVDTVHYFSPAPNYALSMGLNHEDYSEQSILKYRAVQANWTQETQYTFMSQGTKFPLPS